MLLPRALLAAAAIWRSSRLQRSFPLSLDDPYHQRRLQWLAHARDLPGRRVVLLPYSYRIDDRQRQAFATLLEQEFGPGLTIEARPTIVAGDDDDAAAWQLPASGLVVALFALSATPERRRTADSCAASAPVAAHRRRAGAR